VNIGNVTAFEGRSNHSENYLLGSAIVVPETSTIAGFGVISRTASARIVMALYTDRPMSLIAFTEPSHLTDSEQTMRPTIYETVAPGTYWLLAVFDRRASVGFDMTDKTAPVRYVPHDFRRALPQIIESPTRYAGQRFNFYLVTE
jgi:hypothetical protein